MYRKKRFLIYILILLVHVSITAQTHLSVPLGHPIYHILEQAQVRGLLSAQPSVRPFSRARVLVMIDEILANNEERRFGNLTQQERDILEDFRRELNPGRGGLDLLRGTISTEHVRNDVYFSAEFGWGINLGFSASVFPIARGFTHPSGNPEDPFDGANHPGSGDVFTGIDSGIYFTFSGDLGRNASYGLIFGGAFLRTPRAILGRTNTFSPGWVNDRYPYDIARRNRQIISFSEPLTFFPFTYRKPWDGSVWFMGRLDAGGFEGWPQTLSVGYYMIPELAGTFLNGNIHYRIARVGREWAGMSNNASLVLGQTAQPFLGAEITFTPFSWISFSSLTGVLEYGYCVVTGDGGIKEAAETFQNAFSINMLEFNIRERFHIGFGSAAVWPRRFELGYLFPWQDNFLYQNNIGDFDNMALFLNLRAQQPGLGRLWFSLFLDEISLGDINRDFFNMSRMMFAYQIGASVHIPWFRRLGFSSLTISYTKIEPFTYTHTRERVPWYGDLPMETNWVNRGRALGHYLPPNSDELLVRFDTMPALNSMISIQYQLIRHGATFGDRAVAGSSRWSELDPWGRNRKPNLRKFFLRDGAYQWMQILRVRGEYSFTGSNIPVRVFAEVGGVYSFFTDICNTIEPNSGRAHPFRRINTPQYPTTLSFIGVIGIQIFPKF